MSEERSHTRKIVITGVMAAVSIVLGATRMGFIPWLSGASLTIMHVPVIIGAILEGPVVGMVVGLIFGLFSLIQAAVSPTGAVDVFFTNPLISVLPRILVGLITWLAFRSFRGRFLAAATISASIVGSLANSVLVLGALGAAGALPWPILGGVLVVNGLPEAAAAAVIATAVILSWRSAGLRKRSDLADLEEE